MKKVQNYLAGCYIQAIQKSIEPLYNPEEHKSQVQQAIGDSRITRKQFKDNLMFENYQFVDDVLEVAQDFQVVKKNLEESQRRLKRRVFSHFTGLLYKKVQESLSRNKWINKAIDMYRCQQFSENPYNSIEISRYILSCTIYFPGITKGNGVIMKDDTIVTCAHVVCDQASQKKHSKLKPFITGTGAYGIVSFQSNLIFRNKDVAYGKITEFYGQKPKPPHFLSFPEIKQSMKCVQVGLLYDPDNYIETFQTNAGFIEKKQYKDSSDTTLSDEMGLLIHDCYGLWGTSGSPLWSQKGQVIGIHNSWNQNSQNVCMIIHEENQKVIDRCRIIRQYERRAIASHVLVGLLQQKQVDKEPVKKVPYRKPIRKINKKKKLKNKEREIQDDES